jgi:inhibitor of growth protein 3
MPADPQMPTLLRDSPGNMVPPTSSVNTGTSTPLQNIPVNTITTANLNNATVASLQRAATLGRMGSPAVSSMPSHQIHNPSHIANQNIAAAMLNRNRREASTGANPNNRANRPNHLGIGNIPAQSSGLVRQTSLGPGTPKPSTPGANFYSARRAARWACLRSHAIDS